MKNIFFYLLFFLLYSPLSFASTNIDTYTFDSPEEAQRFLMLTKETRCVVCQNQNLADSTAPLANDLREKIYLLVKEKKSAIEIKDYLAKRYGEYILLKPRLNKLTFFLWVFPCLLLIISCYLLRRLYTQPKNLC